MVINFNFVEFTSLEVDLRHINKDERSSFTVNEVALFVISSLEGKRLEPSDEKVFGDQVCSYFVTLGEFRAKEYKLVFCICSDRFESIGVITLHRV